MYDFKLDARFKDIKPFKEKVWLSSPTMHGKIWMSTVGENINELEKALAEYVGVKFAIFAVIGALLSRAT